MPIRFGLAVVSFLMIPLLLIGAYLRWTKAIRSELASWRKGAGSGSMLIVLALWLYQTVRWAFLLTNGHFDGLLGADWREIEMFLLAFYAYAALALAFALRGTPRLQLVAACFL